MFVLGKEEYEGSPVYVHGTTSGADVAEAWIAGHENNVVFGTATLFTEISYEAMTRSRSLFDDDDDEE